MRNTQQNQVDINQLIKHYATKANAKVAILVKIYPAIPSNILLHFYLTMNH